MRRQDPLLMTQYGVENDGSAEQKYGQRYRRLVNLVDSPSPASVVFGRERLISRASDNCWLEAIGDSKDQRRVRPKSSSSTMAFIPAGHIMIFWYLFIYIYIYIHIRGHHRQMG